MSLAICMASQPHTEEMTEFSLGHADFFVMPLYCFLAAKLLEIFQKLQGRPMIFFNNSVILEKESYNKQAHVYTGSCYDYCGTK